MQISAVNDKTKCEKQKEIKEHALICFKWKEACNEIINSKRWNKED